MIRLDAERPISFCDGMTRRDFLHAGALPLAGLSLPAFTAMKAEGAVQKGKDVNCIMMFLLGGKQRTVAEWQGLVESSGLELLGTIPTETNYTYLELSLPGRS